MMSLVLHTGLSLREWSENGSRTGALVMGALPSRSEVRVRSKIAAIKVSDCRLISVICVVVRAGGRLPRRAGGADPVTARASGRLSQSQPWLTQTANHQDQVIVAHLDGR
jgi:hypothetical protein